MIKKIARRLKIKASIRTKVSGTAERPRLTVFRSNSQIYAQVIDDLKGQTLASASSLAIKDKMTKTEKAAEVGKLIAPMLHRQHQIHHPCHKRAVVEEAAVDPEAGYGEKDNTQ